jgi:hypothetical protein
VYFVVLVSLVVSNGVCLVGTSSLFANPLSNSPFPVCDVYTIFVLT